MNYFLTIIICLLFALIGYLIGSILFAPIFSKLYKKNVREVGSGNPGATNIWRAMSKKIGFVVACLDAIKSYVAVIICWTIFIFTIHTWFSGAIWLYATVFIGGVMAIVGHCFPIHYMFFLIFKHEKRVGCKGGKGVATYGGLLFSISPWMALAAFGFWCLIVLFTHYISISSILMPIFASSSVWIPKLNWMYLFQNPIFDLQMNHGFENIMLLLFTWILLLSAGLLVIYRHKNNIRKLIEHKESKFW